MFIDFIKEMHEKFGINCEEVQFTPDEKSFRISAMLEEVAEYAVAKTPEEELDALVDLVVFALGTAERQGFLDLFKRAFYRVMEANMAKELGPNQKRGGFALDLVKPEGWEPANIQQLFEFRNQNKENEVIKNDE